MNKVGKALLLSTPLGLIGYGAYNLVQNEKKVSDWARQQLLINPFLNPTGAVHHMINPHTGITPLDAPLVKYVVSRQPDFSESSRLIPQNLTREERMEWIRKNGGPGLRPDAVYA